MTVVAPPPGLDAREALRIAVGISHGFFVPGLDRDDLAQEACVGALEAVRNYRPETGTPFTAFVRLCVKRQLMDVLNHARAAKRTAVLVPLEDQATVLEEVSGREVMASVRSLPLSYQRTLIGRACGFSQPELAAMEGSSVKSVENRLYAARRMLKEAA